MKKFAAFDIDGTLFRWQLFHEVVFELIKSGYISEETKQKVEQKMQAWRDRSHKHSFRDYELALVEAYIPCIKGLPTHVFTTAAEGILGKHSGEVYTYTRDLIKKLKSEGYTLIALSGSQDEIVQPFAKKWGFDIALGQVHNIENEKYTGSTPGEKLVIEQKGVLLKQLVEENNLSWEGSYAVGDSLSDAQMLALVTHPIAFNPNDLLFEVAKEKGWKIVIERKNMTYELEQKSGTYLLANATAR